MLYEIARRQLFKMEPEKAHHFALNSLDKAHKLGLLKLAGYSPVQAPFKLMGLEFTNRVGLAAGLDKDGEHIDSLRGCGFGFIEVGTVTPRPQPGNPQPRLFRLPEAEAIINRMGFNNKGVDRLVGYASVRKSEGVLGINIGKNFDTPVEKAADDYLHCLRKVYREADYVTVNISSPNTAGLRSLQHGEALAVLLSSLKEEQARLATMVGRYKPLLIKVAPDLSEDELGQMAEAFLAHEIDGVIATNTTLSRDGVEGLQYGSETGGLSGRPVFDKSTQTVRDFHRILGERIPLIAAGGISSAEDAVAKIEAGARMVQIYSGFIYQGPALVKACARALAKLG